MITDCLNSYSYYNYILKYGNVFVCILISLKIRFKWKTTFLGRSHGVKFGGREGKLFDIPKPSAKGARDGGVFWGILSCENFEFLQVLESHFKHFKRCFEEKPHHKKLYLRYLMLLHRLTIYVKHYTVHTNTTD